MPITRSATKRLRADKKRQARNKNVQSKLKTLVKEFQALCDGKKLEDATRFLKTIYAQFDHAAAKKIIHRNVAARKKSRLQKQLLKAAKVG